MQNTSFLRCLNLFSKHFDWITWFCWVLLLLTCPFSIMLDYTRGWTYDIELLCIAPHWWTVVVIDNMLDWLGKLGCPDDVRVLISLGHRICIPDSSFQFFSGHKCEWSGYIPEAGNLWITIVGSWSHQNGMSLHSLCQIGICHVDVVRFEGERKRTRKN